MSNSLLESLRQTIGSRCTITPAIDAQLQRALHHYTNEVTRKFGVTPTTNQEIMRVTFAAMMDWIGKLPKPKPVPKPEPPKPKSAPEQSQQLDGEVDPRVLFEKILAERGGGDRREPPMSLQVTELEDVPPRHEQRRMDTRDDKDKDDIRATLAAIRDALTAMKPALQPKDFITPHPSTIKYRDMEYNLVINSQDRNWLVSSSSQNRYHFNVQFNAKDQEQGTGIQPSVLGALRNIVRVEFIKAILPVEALDVVVPRDCSDNTTIESAFVSALALPYVTVLLDEFGSSNTVGTNNKLDQALAVCQYDSTWRPDCSHFRTNTNRGYTLFFPKLMHAQKVYEPTPLAGFQSMSFQILNPENELLSKTPDSLRIQHVLFGSSFVDASGVCMPYANGEYIFLQMDAWFPLWSFSQLDRILIGGLTLRSTTSPSAAMTLTTWLQAPSGHVVVGVGSDSSGLVNGGANAAGFANYVIIRNRFVDPTTGSTDLWPFAITGTTELQAFADDIATFPSSYQTGAILNLSRQVQLTLRVTTREYDTSSVVRPDNV